MAQSRGFEPPKAFHLSCFRNKRIQPLCQDCIFRKFLYYITILTSSLKFFKFSSCKKRTVLLTISCLIIAQSHFPNLMSSIANFANHIAASKILNISMSALVCSNFSSITANFYFLYPFCLYEICFYQIFMNLFHYITPY